MADLTTTIDTYLAAWAEADPARRADLIGQVWTPDGRLTDPPFASQGRDGIGEMFAAFQSHYPGHHFRRTSGIDQHHDYLRFAWELVSPEGAVVLSGLDVGELAADGRLARITGFFGELPAVAA